MRTSTSVAVALCVAAGCTSDPAGPGAVTDETRVPLAAALSHARQATGFVIFGSAAVDETMAGTIVKELRAAGSLPRSRRGDGTPTDPISQDGYHAAGVLIDHDVITPIGLRFTGEALIVLGWSGLDANRGIAEALLSVLTNQDSGPLVPGMTNRLGWQAIYYFQPDEQVWENSPTGGMDVTLLERRPVDVPCRANQLEDVECWASSAAGRAAGSFQFFARAIGNGSNSVLEFADTAFDLPVTQFRIVDTLRYRDRLVPGQ